MPVEFPANVPKLELGREDIANLLLASVALEEMSLASILSLGEGWLKTSLTQTDSDVREQCRSLEKCIYSISQMQMMLSFKIENFKKLATLLDVAVGRAAAPTAEIRAEETAPSAGEEESEEEVQSPPPPQEETRQDTYEEVKQMEPAAVSGEAPEAEEESAEEPAAEEETAKEEADESKSGEEESDNEGATEPEPDEKEVIPREENAKELADPFPFEVVPEPDAEPKEHNDTPERSALEGKTEESQAEPAEEEGQQQELIPEEAAEVTEAAEAAEAAEVTEVTEVTEAAEATEATEAAEAAEVTEVTEAAEVTEATEDTEAAEAAEPQETQSAEAAPVKDEEPEEPAPKEPEPMPLTLRSGKLTGTGEGYMIEQGDASRRGVASIKANLSLTGEYSSNSGLKYTARFPSDRGMGPLTLLTLPQSVTVELLSSPVETPTPERPNEFLIRGQGVSGRYGNMEELLRNPADFVLTVLDYGRYKKFRIEIASANPSLCHDSGLVQVLVGNLQVVWEI